jgi:transcriptional regulator with XRE-family HTH domain
VSRPAEPRPYDFDDLERLVMARLGVRANSTSPGGWTDDDLADALGITVPHLRELRYRRRMLTERMADRLAVAAGYHPATVWPHWFDDENTTPTAGPTTDEIEARRAKRREYMRNYMRTYRRPESA